MRFPKLLLPFILVYFISCTKSDVINILPPDNDHLLLGNPTGATADTQQLNNYLKDNIYYKLAYSSTRGTPVWVSWHFENSDLGLTPRQDDFRADTSLPKSWFLVQNYSYAGSGFDRGHNCPSADRTSTATANSYTFLMSNMDPFAPKLNQGPWAGLEDFIRTQTGTGNEAYVITGNFGSGGTGSNGFAVSIGGHITVPSKLWKIAIIMPRGNNDLARIDTSVTVIAVDLSNNNDLYTTTTAGRNAWRQYSTSVAFIEQDAAGQGLALNFFSNIPGKIRNYLKTKVYR
jgi:endonuclease G